MTPEYKIKKTILLSVAGDYSNSTGEKFFLGNEDEIEKAWDQLGNDWLQDARNEFRESGEKTNIPMADSRWNLMRCYECDEVAKEMFDGSWVGWTYWYGGGKHGDADAIDWIDFAYDLNCKEEEKLVIVRTFEKVVDKKQ